MADFSDNQFRVAPAAGAIDVEAIDWAYKKLEALGIALLPENHPMLARLKAVVEAHK